MIVVVMGVAGAGKSTVGAAIASQLRARFVDGDRLHPPANVARMRRGIPLQCADREPWLQELTSLMAATEASGQDLVIAASALKRTYRDL